MIRGVRIRREILAAIYKGELLPTSELRSGQPRRLSLRDTCCMTNRYATIAMQRGTGEGARPLTNILLHFIYSLIGALFHTVANSLGAFCHALARIFAGGFGGIGGFVGRLFSGFAGVLGGGFRGFAGIFGS